MTTRSERVQGNEVRCIEIVFPDHCNHLGGLFGGHEVSLDGCLVRHVPLSRWGQQLSEALGEVRRAIADTHLGLEMRAEHLRRASDALARITGRIDVEMLLGKIFSEFCVGK